MLETLNRTVSSNLFPVLVSVVGMLMVVTFFLSKQVAEVTIYAVKTALSERISSVTSQSEENVEKILMVADKLHARVASIRSSVDTLTTEQIQQRLQQVDQRVASLTNQIAGLQQIISPQNASDILNVARMSQEILARKELEGRVTASLTESRAIVQAMKSELSTQLSTLQYWIWGTFLTLIGGLLGSVVYLAKLLSGHLIKLSQSTEEGAARDKSAKQES